jgi:hypothetical protein
MTTSNDQPPEQNDKAKEILASIAQVRKGFEQLIERNDQWVQHLVQAHESGKISYAHFAEMMEAAIAEGQQAERDLTKLCEELRRLQLEAEDQSDAL